MSKNKCTILPMVYSCLKVEITIWSCLIRWLSMRQLNFEFPIYCDVIKNGDQVFWAYHRKNTFFFKSLEREELICLHIVYKSVEIPPLNLVQYDIINFRQLYSSSILTLGEPCVIISYLTVLSGWTSYHTCHTRYTPLQMYKSLKRQFFVSICMHNY